MKKYLQIFTLIILAVAVRVLHIFLNERNYDFTDTTNKSIVLIVIALATATFVMINYLR
jgi:hypothetical protein